MEENCLKGGASFRWNLGSLVPSVTHEFFLEVEEEGSDLEEIFIWLGLLGSWVVKRSSRSVF